MWHNKKKSRHAAKKHGRRSHAAIKKASVRSAVRSGSSYTVNKPKGW